MAGGAAVVDPRKPMVQVPDAGAWERWLEANHERSDGVWLKIAKRGAPAPTPTYAQALEVAICYGWIDGQKGAHDESYWLQRFTRRGLRSRWSEINREKAERLLADGRMTPAGLAQVDAARADGRWGAAYPSQSGATVPEDLQRELDRHPVAAEFFATLTGTDRYAFLYRLHNVKTRDGRARRIARYIELLDRRRTLSDPD
jgi:uncharacterized protein YdeI (YjbR/CyaY-like superfamily)